MDALKKLLGSIGGAVNPGDSSTLTRYLFSIAAGLGGLLYVATYLQVALCQIGITPACESVARSSAVLRSAPAADVTGTVNTPGQ